MKMWCPGNQVKKAEQVRKYVRLEDWELMIGSRSLSRSLMAVRGVLKQWWGRLIRLYLRENTNSNYRIVFWGYLFIHPPIPQS